MNRYCCHCTAQLFDSGFKSNVTSRPTIIVEAENEENAIKKARQKFIKEYTDRTVSLNKFSCALIRKI